MWSLERHRFIEGFLTSSLLFCTGPLTILGSLNVGLELGADKLVLKATLDGFAAIAFAASVSWGWRPVLSPCSSSREARPPSACSSATCCWAHTWPH